jgi:hypothetical protein
MPKKPEVPKHWEEGAEQPEWMDEDEGYPEDKEMYEEEETEGYDLGAEAVEMNGSEFEAEPEFVEKDEELDLLESQLAEQEALLEKKEREDLLKGKKRDVKRKIRQIKYKPLYEAGETAKEAGKKLVGAMKKARGTPEQRAVRRERAKAMGRKMSAKAKRFMESMKEERGTPGSQYGSEGREMFGGTLNGGGMMGQNMFGEELGGGTLEKLSGADLSVGGGGAPAMMQSRQPTIAKARAPPKITRANGQGAPGGMFAQHRPKIMDGDLFGGGGGAPSLFGGSGSKPMEMGGAGFGFTNRDILSEATRGTSGRVNFTRPRQKKRKKSKRRK